MQAWPGAEERAGEQRPAGWVCPGGSWSWAGATTACRRRCEQQVHADAAHAQTREEPLAAHGPHRTLPRTAQACAGSCGKGHRGPCAGERTAARGQEGARGQRTVTSWRRLHCEASYEASSRAVSPRPDVSEAAHRRGTVHVPLQGPLSSWVPLRAEDPSHLLGLARAWKSGPLASAPTRCCRGGWPSRGHCHLFPRGRLPGPPGQGRSSQPPWASPTLLASSDAGTGCWVPDLTKNKRNKRGGCFRVPPAPAQTGSWCLVPGGRVEGPASAPRHRGGAVNGRRRPGPVQPVPSGRSRACSAELLEKAAASCRHQRYDREI